MRSSNQKPRFRDTTSMAGWLFADLFLGLIVVFMASSRAESYLQPTNTPTLTPSPTLTAIQSSKSTATVQPPEVVGLDIDHPLRISVKVGDISAFLQDNQSSTDNFFNQFNSQFKENDRRRRAGLVIALGYHNADNIGRARQLANYAVDLIQSKYPAVFSKIVEKTYWWDPDANHPIGTVDFEIYFYTK